MEFRGEVDLEGKIKEWLAWDRNEKTRNEIQELVACQNTEELKKRLLESMEFGTAGLRARMGAGYSMMNDLTVMQAAQGLCRYVLETLPDARQQGVVIGFDARHNSKRWAWISAAVFLQMEVPAYLFSDITPTPFVPFGIQLLGCACGIMVTASHNPKDDNGYKVYWQNGAQIISPHDKGIAAQIKQNLTPWERSWDVDAVTQHALRKDPLEQLSNAYFGKIAERVTYRSINQASALKMVYTAMHGVGYTFACKCMQAYGFKPCIPVEEQILPDPEFPTVKFPNPEEGKSALDLAVSTANRAQATLIFATDPDADRLGIAELNLKTNKWRILNGNEIATLLGWWSWRLYTEKHPGVGGKDVFMIASTVSSKMLRTMAEAEGFNFMESLTGFKWIGNLADKLEKEGKRVIFAFEEAIGFMVSTTPLDKDGISAMGTAAEMAAYLHQDGLQLQDQLDLLYQRYGCHVSNNSYWICYSQPTIKKIFERLRNFNGQPKQYPAFVGTYKVQHVRDLTAGYDSSQPNGIPTLPVSSASQMITFTFENGCVATLRTSGTEPKIKYYTELRDLHRQKTEAELTVELQNMVVAIVQECLQPHENSLIERAP